MDGEKSLLIKMNRKKSLFSRIDEEKSLFLLAIIMLMLEIFFLVEKI